MNNWWTEQIATEPVASLPLLSYSLDEKPPHTSSQLPFPARQVRSLCWVSPYLCGWLRPGWCWRCWCQHMVGTSSRAGEGRDLLWWWRCFCKAEWTWITRQKQRNGKDIYILLTYYLENLMQHLNCIPDVMSVITRENTLEMDLAII